MSPENLIKSLAADHGFSFCTIAKSELLQDAEAYLETWLKKGKHGSMSYMENHRQVRVNPNELLPGAKSVICLAYNYYTKQTQVPGTLKIAKYAYGRDYHKVMKRKMKALAKEIKEKLPAFNFRCFVDSAPILEREWARKSGLGWMGKNTMIINPKMGSFFFLGEIVCDVELTPDPPIKDYCGTCTSCLDTCPTGALEEPYRMDGSKCISYATIELKDETIPSDFKGKMEDWIFGCDICQDVCPWNRFSVEHNESAFNPIPDLVEMTRNQWQNLTTEQFNDLFEGSAVKRTKFEGLKRNIRFATQSGQKTRE